MPANSQMRPSSNTLAFYRRRICAHVSILRHIVSSDDVIFLPLSPIFFSLTLCFSATLPLSLSISVLLSLSVSLSLSLHFSVSLSFFSLSFLAFYFYSCFVFKIEVSFSHVDKILKNAALHYTSSLFQRGYFELYAGRIKR